MRLVLSLAAVTREASATRAAAALAAQCFFLDVSCLLLCAFVLWLFELIAALLSKSCMRPLLEARALLSSLSGSMLACGRGSKGSWTI